jgi:long-chain acyl-CoA synthetase
LTTAPGYRPLLISTGVRGSALRTPDKIALTVRDQAIAYAALVERFNRIAHLAMAELGLVRRDHVALMLPNGIDFLALVCGLSDVGIISAIVNPQAPPREIAYICNDSQARILFVHPSLEPQARAAACVTLERIVVLDATFEALLAVSDPSDPDITVDETDIFSILYTSGTTGEAKGVMLAHRSRTFHMLLSIATNQGRAQTHMRGLAVAPFANGAGFINGLAPIWFGGSCHIVGTFDAEATLRDIAERRITSVFLVPTQFHAIFNLPPDVLARYDVSSLEVIVAGAAALPQATKERIVAHFGEGRLFEGYGSTEAGGITSLRPEDQLLKRQCVGRPLTGVEAKIVSEAGAAMQTGEIGELICRSPLMFQGYWNRDAETREVLRDGWYHSGDLGYFDPDGYLYIVDRKKNMIISGGQNIFPREIEEVLYQHPGVAEAAIVGEPDPYWGEAVIAYLVASPGHTLDPAALKAHCAEHLARYKIPKAFRVISEMPKNATGKIMHRALRQAPPQP